MYGGSLYLQQTSIFNTMACKHKNTMNLAYLIKQLIKESIITTKKSITINLRGR